MTTWRWWPLTEHRVIMIGVGSGFQDLVSVALLGWTFRIIKDGASCTAFLLLRDPLCSLHDDDTIGLMFASSLTAVLSK